MSRRGGARVGSGGPSATTLPATAATGQPYGEAGTQLQAQKQVPMGTGAPAPQQPPPPPQGAPGQPGQIGPEAQALLGNLRPLSGPTSTPNVPMTQGLASGPGAGPEAFQQFKPDPLVQAAAAFSAIPTTHLTPQMRAIAAATQASASNASLPGIAQGQ